MPSACACAQKCAVFVLFGRGISLFVSMAEVRWCAVLVASLSLWLPRYTAGTVVGVEEDWGEGLKVLSTYIPETCELRAQNNDVIHYHYVGRLDNGTEFGKSFDYDSPYIVSLGQSRIIAGMDRGLVGTCLWERRRITFPSHLGYGSTGVGSIIPPHATLVFYIRMIKIERSGVEQSEDTSLEDLWLKAMSSYNNNEWETVIDRLERGIVVFNAYQNATLLCLQQCSKRDSPQLSERETETVRRYAGDDRVILQFLTYASRARCVRECKAKSLSATQRYPSPEILNRFKQRDPYSFLHFSYYQLDNHEEGAKCFFTFMFYNIESELVPGNNAFYRKVLDLGKDEFIWREPPTQPHQDVFLEGLEAYESEHYLEAVDLIESSLPLYVEALDQCLLLCEDMLVMNITEENMGEDMREILEYYAEALTPDMLDYHSVLTRAIKEVLECRVRCHDDVARVKGVVLVDYLPHHFHYLQFAYFKLGQLLKAAETAATYQGMIPSDEVMLANIRYYTNIYKLQADDFVPRDEYVEITDKLATEKRLLHFATHHEPKKKEGRRGEEAPHHEEL